MPITYTYIDCHAHVYPPLFPEDEIKSIQQRAWDDGVRAIVTVPETLEDAEKVLQLSKAYPLLKPCAGIHPVQPIPNHNDPNTPACRSVAMEEVYPMLEFIRQHHQDLVAIGEIGLDFSPHVFRGNEEESKEIQRNVFREQLKLAKELDLPVNVHSRSAGHYCIEELVHLGIQKALLHAFDGKAGHALKGAEHGYFFSVPPSIVRSPQMQKLVKQVPIQNLVLETDSPALPPIAKETNYPWNVSISCAEIARIKGMGVEEVADIMMENTKRLFPRIKVD